ncbi:MAG TPA: hypothetical protein D7I00_00870 [Candidatus Poseidoniales archaeon]|nr:MAG TPA: hypothetical protein D7I00_00870 [Candidatus Poseidoniales archaeon]
MPQKMFSVQPSNQTTDNTGLDTANSDSVCIKEMQITITSCQHPTSTWTIEQLQEASWARSSFMNQ